MTEPPGGENQTEKSTVSKVPGLSPLRTLSRCKVLRRRSPLTHGASSEGHLLEGRHRAFVGHLKSHEKESLHTKGRVEGIGQDMNELNIFKGEKR